MIANAGTTATGAIDRFDDLAPLYRERGIWLHADGAYGAFACLADRGREALTGVEPADSMRHFGVAPFRAAVATCLDLAQRATTSPPSGLAHDRQGWLRATW